MPDDSSVKTFSQEISLFLRGFLRGWLFVVGFILLYYQVIFHTVDTWSDPGRTHGPLILAVIIYLIWIKKEDIRQLNKRPALLSGSLLLLIGCFALFAGKLGSTILLQQLSMIPVILGAILLCWGWSHFKAYFIPVGYLVFLTGFLEMILSAWSIYLQLVAAWLAAKILSIFGMPVLLNGIIIELPHIALEVASVCNGVNNIVALMALSIVLALVIGISPVKKIILVFTSIAVGIFANGVRIALIGVYALYNRGADIHGPYETMAMSFIFFFGMILLVAISQLLKLNFHRSHNEKSTVSNELNNKNINEPYNKKAPLAVVLLIFFTTFLMIHFYQLRPVVLQEPLDHFPSEIGAFSKTNTFVLDEKLRPFPADDELFRRYENSSGGIVDLYIGYFSEQNKESKIIDYRRIWMYSNAEQKNLKYLGIDAYINQLEHLGDTYYFFDIINDKIATDPYTGKINTFLSGLFKRRTNGFIVVVKTSLDVDLIYDLLHVAVDLR